MAIVHFINRPKSQTASGMKAVLSYTMQEKKTVADGKKFVSGINCTPASAYAEFKNTKRLFHKEDGRQYYHFVQSFAPGERVTLETAHEIALRLASESEKLKGFEIVVSTHCDKDHIHSHFVMNSVNAATGKKFHINESEIEMLMRESDAIVREYGLSVLTPQPKKMKPMSDREYRSADKGQSWKLRLAIAIDDAMLRAASRSHFIELMELEGYQVKWTDERKYITYTTPEGFKCRDNKLHEEKYLKGNLENEFRIRKEITQRIERAGQAADAVSLSGGALRGGHRTQLESADRLSEISNRYADGDTGWAQHADHESRDRRFSEPADGIAETVLPGQRSGDQAVSSLDAGGGDQRGLADPYNGEGHRATGWESEREFFQRALLGEGLDEDLHEEVVLDLSDPLDAALGLGIDAAYLVADFSNVLEDDRRVEDSTTMRRPRKQKKNTEQTHGQTMG